MMMSNQVKQDGENRLPSDCWLMIFSLLSNADLRAVSLSCKAFREISISSKKSLKVLHPEISMLARHLKRFNRLKNIDLFDFEGDIVEAIREIGRSGISLESLDISTRKLFAGLMESLREQGSNMKALNCRIRTYWDEGVDVDVDVEVIANTFPDLEQLTIHAPDVHHNPIGFRFESLASKLKSLKKIHLCSCNVSDQFIIALSLNCALLKDVTIFGLHDVTGTGFGHLLRNRPNLEALSLSYHSREPQYSSSINIENSISHAKALTSLVLSGTRNTDNILKAIAKAKLRLNKLGLLRCFGLTVSSLLMVLSNHLTELRLQNVRLREKDVKLLLSGDVSKVTHIEIDHCMVTSSTLFLLSTKCPSLIEIKLHSTNLKYHESRLQNIPLNHKIRGLSLNNCNMTNNALLKQFAVVFPNLKVLQLNHCRSVTSEGVEAILKSCKHIKELYSSHYQRAKMFEANDPELVELNLEVLTLRSSRIDDEGLAAIANKCPRLRSLDLSYCQCITTEGIKQVVRNIKTLTSLNLTTFWDHPQNYGALFEWMLSTSNMASLNKIFLLKKDFTREQRDKFLHYGCLLSSLE